MTEQEGRIAPPPVLSQSRLSRSLAVLAQIIAQALGLLLAAGDDRHGVVAGDAAEHIGQLHRVDGRARRIGEPRQRLEQHNDPRVVHAHAALIQNELQALRVVDVVGLAGHGVAAAAAADRLLIKVQLLDIARDGRLLALDAALGETRDELLLRLDIVLFDQLQDLLLSLALHGSLPFSSARPAAGADELFSSSFFSRSAVEFFTGRRG